MIGKLLDLISASLRGAIRQPEFWIRHEFGHNFLYGEGGRTVLIRGEIMTGPDLDFVIYPSSIVRWRAPHDSEPINEEKRRQILERLENWLRAHHLRYEFE